MENVEIRSPSFPDVPTNEFLEAEHNIQWHVLCGDKDHWRMGYYSPEASDLNQIEKLEKHTCPELFILMEGEVILVLAVNNELRTLKLEKFKPVLVDTWHNAFCPGGALSGKVLIIERDHFTTEYRATKDCKTLSS
jgi:hypothetical protein